MNILRKFTVFTAVIAAMMALPGCSEEQSSLSLEDFPGKAKLSGTLSYNEGQAYSNGKYTELNKVAANTPLYVLISNADLVGDAKGYTTLETVTDAEGKYEIEIPVPDGGISVRLRAPSFTGTRTLVKDWENNSPVFENQEVVFKMDESLDIEPDDILVENLKYGFVEREEEVALVTEVPLTVKVGLGVFDREGRTALSYQSGVSVLIRVYYDELEENGYNMLRYYGATTDFNGEAKFNIPAPRKDWSDVRIDMKALPFHVNTFDYYDYYNSYSSISGGTYKQYYSRNQSLDLWQYDDDVSFTESNEPKYELKMVFVPDDDVNAHGYYWGNYNW